MNRELKEYRCYINNKLLCKAGWEGQIEIMNNSNRQINYTWPSRKHQDIWPKGVEFQSKSCELRCKWCERLMCRGIWTTLLVEVKCQYCKTMNLFDLADLQKDRLWQLSIERRKIIEKNLT